LPTEEGWVGMQRKVVVEIERFQIVRRTAQTRYSHCLRCGAHADFVSIETAADLFEVSNSEMMSALKIGNCHIRLEGDEQRLICLNSLIRSMKESKGSVRRLGKPDC